MKDVADDIRNQGMNGISGSMALSLRNGGGGWLRLLIEGMFVDGVTRGSALCAPPRAITWRAFSPSELGEEFLGAMAINIPVRWTLWRGDSVRRSGLT
ncbi:hypothetical protein Cflav_PD2073 [Pedosphaera parvula Ellin514]|uniref:Uncharacterized protein n=1 Tax=Pedosphaera parvula (strain Ellin514) TaxID=320771 RepID=B9XMI2_PEDPL|nr:hypothetical protein Cflav_PD2073 [Pedosphaera parvula Ellin514]